MNQALALAAHTTHDISNAVYLDLFCQHLLQCFGLNDICVRFASDSDRPIERQYAKIDRAEFAVLYQRGGAGIYSPELGIAGGITWHRVPLHEKEAFVQKRGYLQNQISLDVPEVLLESQEQRARFRAFCCDMANHFKTNYLYVYDRLVSHYNVHDTYLNIGFGLLDVHWINIFGGPFIELIGRERLLATPAFAVTETGADQVMIVIMENSKFADSEFQRARQIVRHHIGEAYFAKGRKPQRSSRSGVFGVFELIRTLRRASTEFYDVSAKAAKTATFDFSKIFIDRGSEKGSRGSTK